MSWNPSCTVTFILISKIITASWLLFFNACSGKARDNTVSIQFKLTFSGQKDDPDADPASVIRLDLACKYVAKHLPRFNDLRLRVRRFQCLDEDAIWRPIFLQFKGLRSILVETWKTLATSLYKNGSELRLCGGKVCRSLCESMVLLSASRSSTQKIIGAAAP